MLGVLGPVGPPPFQSDRGSPTSPKTEQKTEITSTCPRGNVSRSAGQSVSPTAPPDSQVTHADRRVTWHT